MCLETVRRAEDLGGSKWMFRVILTAMIFQAVTIRLKWNARAAQDLDDYLL